MMFRTGSTPGMYAYKDVVILLSGRFAVIQHIEGARALVRLYPRGSATWVHLEETNPVGLAVKRIPFTPYGWRRQARYLIGHMAKSMERQADKARHPSARSNPLVKDPAFGRTD